MYFNIIKQVLITTIDNLKKYKFSIKHGQFLADICLAFSGLYFTIWIVSETDSFSFQIIPVIKHCLVFTLLVAGIEYWHHTDANRYFIFPKIFSKINFSVSFSLFNIQSLFDLIKFSVLVNLFYHPLMLIIGGVPSLAIIVNTILLFIGLILNRILFSLIYSPSVNTHSVVTSSPLSAIVVGCDYHIVTWLNDYKKRSVKSSNIIPYVISGIVLSRPLKENDPALPFPSLGLIQDFRLVTQKLSTEKNMPERLLISQEALANLSFRQILVKLMSHGTSVLLFEEVLPVKKLRLRPLKFSDLIGKISLDSYTNGYLPDFVSERHIIWQEIEAVFDKTCVMITGVEDLVAHQLACIIAGLCPKNLLLTSSSEYALQGLRTELNTLYPNIACNYILTSVTDHKIIEKIVNTYQPHFVFHSDRVTCANTIAENLPETVQKNILSTLHLAQLLHKTKAQAFILMNAHASTSLAHSITTLISQEIQRIDQTYPHPDTRFLVINTCEVWGNLDSTSAFWEEQLSNGLDINLSSADNYSWLLSAQDAAQAILRSIIKVIEKNTIRGQSLQLSGNEPLRFYELLKSFSFMKGYNPDHEIKFNFHDKISEISLMHEDNTSIQETITPGIILTYKAYSDNNYQNISNDNHNILIRLAELVAKHQSVKIAALFGHKISQKTEPQLTSLDLAG